MRMILHPPAKIMLVNALKTGEIETADFCKAIEGRIKAACEEEYLRSIALAVSSIDKSRLEKMAFLVLKYSRGDLGRDLFLKRFVCI